ncbi:MAG: hypothetical protein F6K54_38240 [Okeania sp. SIO3B5]|uniref:hypothetical protein n=1 Tax=Okeania sp. SIO3B5 TaxID=2607811 RepID=UPI001400CAC0|nr:hypothetical protein [Okeania sp. SIO3B5]NEO58384.1 hypothetical protein [Okeania sp. SIO3B5]
MMEKLIRNLGKKILAITVACLVGFFSLPAIAQATCIEEPPVPVENGSCSYTNTDPVPVDLTVNSAIIDLPPGETGTIDEILITGPNGPEYSCSNINVANGTDLIPACGQGSAVLKAGMTTLEVQGSNFQPQTNFDDFRITLCGD